MTYRRLALFPFALLALGAIGVLVVGASSRDAWVQGEVDLAKLLAWAGMGAAALAFERGDYLRRGWGLWAVNYGLLLGRDAALLFAGSVSPAVLDGVRSVFLAGGNVCLVVGAWTLARAWGVAGLEHPGSTGARRAVVAAAVLLALVLAGPGLVADARGLASGSLASVGLFASDVGDILSLPIVAPVALTAVAVRGGTLRWPWTLLTGSLMAWLVYDATYLLPDLVPAHAAALRQASEQFHALACALACAAGLAQRKAVVDDDEADEAVESPAGPR